VPSGWQSPPGGIFFVATLKKIVNFAREMKTNTATPGAESPATAPSDPLALFHASPERVSLAIRWISAETDPDTRRSMTYVLFAFSDSPNLDEMIANLGL